MPEVLGGRRATDEAAVDLDLVEGKAAPMAQASSVPPRPEEENQIGGLLLTPRQPASVHDH
jgi:hypothetical protein